ncbi:MAG: transglycosylase SLT domain-containing protein [Roseobacter sp.]
MTRFILIALSLLLLKSCVGVEEEKATDSTDFFPALRWNHVPQSDEWEEAAVAALETHGLPLVEMVPADIDTWCPAYEGADVAGRQAFWVGFMSALAKHESTYRPEVVSSNGKWFGLLQISPATARGYGCRAGSGTALKVGGENLSCAIRIMSVTVPRDGVVYANDGRWRGVAADWGPLRVASKRQDISGWLNAQPFCAPQG